MSSSMSRPILRNAIPIPAVKGPPGGTTRATRATASITSSPATSKCTPTMSPTQASVTSSPPMNIPLCDRSTASAKRNSSTVANCSRTSPATLTRGARPPEAFLKTARLIPHPRCENGSRMCGQSKKTATCGAATPTPRFDPDPDRDADLLQIPLRPQRRLDALAGVSHLQTRRLAGQLFHQLHVAGGELGAHFVRDVRVWAVSLVAALIDQPLPEEFLVQHPLVLAPAELLLAALGDP